MTPIANVASTTTVAELQKKVNQILTLAVNNPLFNAKVLIANGNVTILQSNGVFKARSIFQGAIIANNTVVVKGATTFQRPVTANGGSFSFNANTTHSGVRNSFVNLHITGDVQGNRLSVNANTIMKGSVIVQNNLTANGSSVTIRANTTFTGANVNITGRSSFIRANTTFQASNTNIRGRSSLVTANIVFGGSARFLGSFSGVSVGELDDVARVAVANGSVLVYHTANNTWAPGIIDGGTY